MALDEKDIEAVKGLIGEANKPITDALTAQSKVQEDLTKNLGIIADTLKNAPPAKAADDKGDKKSEAVTPDAVAKIVTDAIANDRKQQTEQAQQADAKKAAREKVVKDKLGGDAELGAYLPDTADEAQLAAAADKLASKVTPKAKVPGTAADKGTPSARQPIDFTKLNASQKVGVGFDQLLAQNA